METGQEQHEDGEAGDHDDDDDVTRAEEQKQYTEVKAGGTLYLQLDVDFKGQSGHLSSFV